MGTAKPTVERRQLGLTLRRLREGANASQAAAGKAIGRTPARISQVENGIGALSHDDLVSFLDHFEVDGEERTTVLALGAEARRRSRRATYTDNLPGSFQRLADLQAEAVAIFSYDTGIVPGLLQSPDYMQAVIHSCNGVWWEPSQREVENRVRFRREQQRRALDAETPKRLFCVLTEDALHHKLGSSSVMRGQILHLLQLLESQPGLSLQVVPGGASDNPLLGGGIMLLEFDNAPRIGFSEPVYGPAVYHENEEDTAAFSRAFHRVRELALSSEDSRDLLMQKLKEQWT